MAHSHLGARTDENSVLWEAVNWEAPPGWTAAYPSYYLGFDEDPSVVTLEDSAVIDTVDAKV